MVAMSLLRYITHPNVEIDPGIPVPDWRLSEEGRRRARAMLEQPWMRSLRKIVSNSETKALEAATMWADHLDLTVEVRPSTGETNRTATGFVSSVRHEELGTLMMCHLAGLEVDRKYDQPGQGHYWTFDRENGHMINRWLPIDLLYGREPDSG